MHLKEDVNTGCEQRANVGGHGAVVEEGEKGREQVFIATFYRENEPPCAFWLF